MLAKRTLKMVMAAMIMASTAATAESADTISKGSVNFQRRIGLAFPSFQRPKVIPVPEPSPGREDYEYDDEDEVIQVVPSPRVRKVFTLSSKFMELGGYAVQPQGHTGYCKRHSEDCVPHVVEPPVRLGRGHMSDLEMVNNTVNRTVVDATDSKYYKVEEYWTYPEKYGDCEDYVLEKRRMLKELGWPISSLLITVVADKEKKGYDHAVLTVRTDKGDYILDNIDSRILTWDETKYRYIARQSEEHSGWWRGINDFRKKAVAYR